ncbi:hypothetical protein NP493_3637g00002 [Ridgeia piscesae]|uniref:Uncharacterized protein n=1 Tax=Ridgeia piscesae TaxID=27915 RepID=A0AAD9J523_RIDPI|nr:hypothetical protein NP493_3637g00002 [Ridgeia piscesae]
MTLHCGQPPGICSFDVTTVFPDMANDPRCHDYCDDPRCHDYCDSRHQQSQDPYQPFPTAGAEDHADFARVPLKVALGSAACSGSCDWRNFPNLVNRHRYVLGSHLSHS